MHILMFSINPVYPDKVIGGSTRHLQDVAVYLAQHGHEVTLLCTRRQDNQVAFDWHPQVSVKPILPFHQPFPQPYDIPPHDMALIFRIVMEHLDVADRFYIHDGELLFPFLSTHKPTIVSLRDNAYPESRLGSFLFAGDALIVISEYSKDVCLKTVGQFLPDLKNRIVVIPNTPDMKMDGLAEPSSRIYDYIGLNPSEDYIILHPHRPEIGKGLQQTIEVVDRLFNRYHCRHLKVLVPRWFDEIDSPSVVEWISGIRVEISQRGLDDIFYFHPWVPRDLMADYYRLGNLTLALGNIVEAFGNAPYESLACGTPAIVSRVGPHRSLVPDSYLPKVDFNDHDNAARIAHGFLSGEQKLSDGMADWIGLTWNHERQLATYAEVILSATKKPQLEYDYSVNADQEIWELAPWCDFHHGKIYHDFRQKYYDDRLLLVAAESVGSGMSKQLVKDLGISELKFQGWVEDGLWVRR